VVRPGGEIQLSDNAGAEEVLAGLTQIQGLMEKTSQAERRPKREHRDAGLSGGVSSSKASTPTKKSAATKERVFSAGEKPPKKQERVYEPKSRASDGSEDLIRVPSSQWARAILFTERNMLIKAVVCALLFSMTALGQSGKDADQKQFET